MQIWLLRHAQAEASASSGRDEDRRLTAAGRMACHRLQDWLRDYRDPLPGTLLVSPARRTLETAETALDRLGLPSATVEPRLWNASTGELVALMQRPESLEQPLLLVGHNPGLEDLVIWLCGGIPLPGMKPGTLAIIDIEPPLRPSSGRLAHFFQPSESM
ncbi:MAG: SixA phosphatase family protein [Wenzhouxiangella sp.]